MASQSPRAPSEPLPAATLWLAAASALVLALIVAPRVFHNYDVVDCFLTWARASHGRQPWAIYLTHFATDDCDYPPVVPYLLTLVERARLALGAGETSGAAIPLFVNAAAWGQFDALLSLFVVAALVALLRGQAGRAGAALGLALATKLLAVVAIPVLALWAWRRRGARAILAGAAAALLVMALAAMPYVARGAARPVLSSYHGAVGYYPLRTVEAYNLWYVLDRVDIRMRGQPSGEARLDTRPFVGPLTHRDVGLLLVAAWTVFILAGLWRWPGDGGLVLAAAFQFFAVFMLPTQMHQRYILPAAVLLALVAPLSPRARTLFAVLAVTATLNQGLDLGRAVLDHAVQVDPSRIGDPPAIRMAIRNVATGVALVHVGLLAWWTAVYRRELAALAALTPRGAAGFAAAPRPE